MPDGSALGIQVLAGRSYSTYVAVRIIGSVPRRLVTTILSLIPGCQLDAWMSDYGMPEGLFNPERARCDCGKAPQRAARSPQGLPSMTGQHVPSCSFGP